MAVSRRVDRQEVDEIARLLSLAINETDRAVMVLDRGREVVFVNKAFTELFGYTSQDVLGLRPTLFLAGEKTNPATIQRIQTKAAAMDRFSEEVLFYSKDRREIWISGTVNPIPNEEGEINNLVVVLVDITETKKIRQMQQAVLEAVASGLSLAETASLLCRHVESIAPDVISSIVSVDDEGKIHALAGPRLPEEYTAAIEGQSIGGNKGCCGTAAYRGEAVCVTDIETDPLWKDLCGLALSVGLKACWSSPIKLRNDRIAGTFAFYFSEKGAPSLLHKELVDVGLHLCSMVFERDEARRKIARLSEFDSLTGLKNRSTFSHTATELLNTSPGTKHAFFVVDLDRFKDINDTFGHGAGDQLLIAMASRIERVSKSSGIVCRLSGDSFGMLIPDCDVSRASALADRVMEELKKPVEVQGMDLNLTFCVGIAIAEGREHDAEAYVERAIAAMHKAKETGRSCYQFFSPEMNRIAQERMILGTALRHAMAQNSLHLVYQPQINLKTNELSGVEALCRWTDPVLGEIAPSRFIPLAEEINEIEAIARWTLREACRQMALWKQTGRQLPAISVNLSPVNFRDSKLQDYIQNLLHEYKLPPKQLTIEITENVMLDNPQSSVTVLHKLHDLGCGISLDDFGTGFSSLSRLARLPITELKLDRSFMRSFEEDPNSQAVALAVIRIGQSLGIEVVAEGVETEGQEKLLRHLGCDRLQGYLRGRPMTARELEDWLANQPQRGGLFVAAPHSGRPRHAT